MKIFNKAVKVVLILLALTMVSVFQNCGPTPASGSKKPFYMKSETLTSSDPATDTYGTGTVTQVAPAPKNGDTIVWTNLTSGGGTTTTTISQHTSGNVVTSAPRRADFQVVHDAHDYKPAGMTLVGGPVNRIGLNFYWAEQNSGHGDLYQPPQDSAGCYHVKVGNRIMLDSTPHGDNCNSNCNYTQGPIWYASNDPAFYHVAKDDNGYLMRLKPMVEGATDYVFVNVDGVDSNAVCFTTSN
jgi:hypothetical protein